MKVKRMDKAIFFDGTVFYRLDDCLYAYREAAEYLMELGFTEQEANKYISILEFTK